MPELSEKELKRISKAFKVFDENGDGTISKVELKRALNNMGFEPTDKQLKQMILDVDSDNNGTIDLEEFKRMAQMSTYLKSTTIFTVDQIREMRSMFDNYDTSGDGVLSGEELGNAMKKLGQKLTEAQVDEMMASVDTDNNGEVDFVEFLDMMSASERMKLATTHKVKRHSEMVGVFIRFNNERLGFGLSSTEEPSSSTASTSEETDDDEEAEMCTNNIKTLAITAFLFALITGLQTVGALFVGSKALMADCVSMGVDSCTYVANIFVECQKGTRCYKPSELMVGSVSLAILSYFTWVVMAEAVETLRTPDDEEEEESPWMPWMVLFFAVLGLTFDACALYFFHKESEDAGRSANMFTALLHVGADFLRSGTTFISSLLMFAGMDTAKVDSIAAIIIGITILCGAAYGAWDLLLEARRHVVIRAHPDSDSTRELKVALRGESQKLVA